MKHSLLILAAVSATLTFLSCAQSNSSESVNNKEDITIAKEGKVNIDGFELKYIKRGIGEPVVVVGSSDYYSKAFSQELEDHYEFIFIDSRHFVPDCNPTQEQLETFNLATLSNDLEKVRRQLNLNKFNLVGHSVHGQIALDYATKYPENVNGLIIIGGVSYFDEDFGTFKDELWNSLANEERNNIMQMKSKKLEDTLGTIPENEKFAFSYNLNSPLYWADPSYDASSLLRDLKHALKSSINCLEAFLQKIN